VKTVDLQLTEMKALIQVWRRKMNVSYIGKQSIKCEMCSKPSPQAYKYDAIMLKRLFKEAEELFEDSIICEKCAQRESGKKRWPTIRRNKI
jgi:hypothetical protein